MGASVLVAEKFLLFAHLRVRVRDWLLVFQLSSAVWAIAVAHKLKAEERLEVPAKYPIYAEATDSVIDLIYIGVARYDKAKSHAEVCLFVEVLNPILLKKEGDHLFFNLKSSGVRAEREPL